MIGGKVDTIFRFEKRPTRFDQLKCKFNAFTNHATGSKVSVKTIVNIDGLAAQRL
jgi:hypothetical protein